MDYKELLERPLSLPHTAHRTHTWQFWNTITVLLYSLVTMYFSNPALVLTAVMSLLAPAAAFDLILCYDRDLRGTCAVRLLRLFPPSITLCPLTEL
jgi:hypothetical protein